MPTVSAIIASYISGSSPAGALCRVRKPRHAEIACLVALPPSWPDRLRRPPGPALAMQPCTRLLATGLTGQLCAGNPPYFARCRSAVVASRHIWADDDTIAPVRG